VRLHFEALMPGREAKTLTVWVPGISLETPGLVQVINGYVWLIVYNVQGTHIQFLILEDG